MPPGRHAVRDPLRCMPPAFAALASPAVQREVQLALSICAPLPETTYAVRYVQMPPSLQKAYMCLSCAKRRLSVSLLQTLSVLPSAAEPSFSTVFAGAHGSRYPWMWYISRLTCIACVLYHDSSSTHRHPLSQSAHLLLRRPCY
jgi:hypothetical protein